MAKHLSEDEVTLVVNAKADKAQQNIRKFSKEIDNLGERNKSLQRQMESLELAGKKNTDSWKQRREEYGRNATQIRNLKQQIAAETKALDLNALTMAQLRQQARSLQRQLDNTSKTINPEDWKKLSSRLSDVRNRMGELSNASKSLVEKYSNPQTMSFFRGELFVRFAELAGKALQKIKEFAAEGISMAESADGVIHAFRRLDQPGLLDNLRKATKGTVSDIELMKAAVKAKDFHIPLKDLGKYLSFEKSVNDSTAEEITKIKLLQKTIHDTSKSYNQRKKAIQDMQAIVPGYHATISKEGRLFNENTKAIDVYIQNLRRAARAEAAYEKMKDNEKKILDAQDTVSDSSQKGCNVSNAAQRRGINMAAGERVQKKTQVFEGATPGSAMTNEYYVVVDKNGKVLREISKDKAVPIMKDQEWGDMFGARKKVAQDKVQQYTAQNDRLQKVIEQNGGINQKFKSGGKPQGGSPIGSVGAELDTISAKIEALKAKRLTIKVGDTKGLKIIDAQIAALEKRKASLEYGKTSGKAKSKTKTHKGPNPDDVATKDFIHDRAQDIDAEKRSYDKSLNTLKEALAKKTLTQEQYNASASALNIQHQTNLLDIEKTYLHRSENMVFKDAAKKKTLQEGQAKAVADQQQAANTAYIEAEKEYYESLEKIQQLAPNKAQTLKEECDATLLFLDGYYKASLQRAKDNGEREKEVTEYYEAAKAAIIVDYAKKAEEQKAQARQEYGLDTFEDQYAARRKKIEDDSVLNEKDRQQALTLLDQQAEEHRLQIRQQYGLASQQELYNAELDQLKMHLQNKEISEEEYEEAVKNMKIAKMKEAFNFYSNLSSGAVQALQQAEEANVDAKYDAEIEAAKKAGKDTTELEKKKADEKLKIQKKYADVNFAIKASQIIADTATSIMKAYADLGPIAGSIAAALMGVTGVAQLSAANAERQRVKRMSLSGAGGSASASGARVATGLESGGSIDVERRQDGKMFRAEYDPDRRGFIDKPTVLVGEGGYGHSKEWVASNAAVENPTVAPFIDIIDRAQRAGTIRTLDMNKFLIQQAQGRASGGYVTPTVNDVRGVVKDSYKDTLIERLTDVLDRLSVDGIPASVSLNEIEQKQQLQDKARRFGSK